MITFLSLILTQRGNALYGKNFYAKKIALLDYYIVDAPGKK